MPTGAVVGTTDIQILSNKTLEGPVINGGQTDGQFIENATMMGASIAGDLNDVFDIPVENLKPEAWLPWTPHIDGSTTDPTIGTGGANAGSFGQYIQIGGLVHLEFAIKFGTSGMNKGSGQYSITPPVAMAPELTNNPELGVFTAQPAGTSASHGHIYCVGATAMGFYFLSAVPAGTLTTVTDVSPAAWVAGGIFRGCATYAANV